jgi:ribosomal protein L37E
MAFIKCPKCGQTALSVATVCPKCGHILLQSPTPQGDSREFGNCRRCGKIIPRNADVCEFCGYPQLLRRRLRWGAGALVAAAVVVAGIIALLPSMRSATPAPTPPQRPAAAPAPASDTASQAAPTGDTAAPSDTVVPTAAPIRAAPPTTTPTEATAPAPPAAVETQPRRVTTSTLNRWAVTWANIRSGPGSDYQVVRVLRPGERVQVADASRGWWTVYRDGIAAGYVANSVLSDHAPSPDSVPPR